MSKTLLRLADVLRHRAFAHASGAPAYVFLSDGETEAEWLSWAELDARARSIAAVLTAAARPGQRALLLYPSGLDFVAAFFGCLYAGVVAVPADPPRPRREPARLRAIVRDCEPRLALTTTALLPGLEELAAGTGDLAGMSWLATDGLPEESGWEGREPHVDAVAFLQYTSGSTATPKGVMVTHRNLAHNEAMIQAAFGQDEGSVVVGWLPLFHDMGLIGNVLQPFWCGGRCVLMSPGSFLQRPRRWLEAISRYRATTSGGPNFAYDLCARKVPPAEREGLDLSSWRVAFNGSEPVRAETLERFATAFASCGFRRAAFYPCYGLAEATLFVAGGELDAPPRVGAFDAGALERHEVAPHPPGPPLPSPPNQPGEGGKDRWRGRDQDRELPFSPLPGEGRTMGEGPGVRGREAARPGIRSLVSCGRAWLGQRIVVADPESGAECSPGRVGEIWLTGPSVAAGYWRRPEATERDFRAVLAGGDGGERFLRTGDLGFLDGGELFVTGRLKDLVILRGRNHYPQDLERTAEGSHPALRPGSAAAFSVDVEGEERLVLVLEVERRSTRTAGPEETEEIAAAVRRVIAEEHEIQVHEVVLVRPGTILKTSSGKIRRHACRADYLAGGLQVVGASALAAGAPEPVEAAAAELPEREALAALAPEARGEVLRRWLGARIATVLRLPERPDPDRPLTALGLDSLAAMELKAEVESALGAPVSLAELLEGCSLGDLAAGLAGRLEDVVDAAPPRAATAGGAGDHPLSLGQKALWFLERLAPEGAAYNIAVAARVHGHPDTAALRRAFERLAARHPTLRTTFPVVDGEPVQRVAEAADVDFEEVDASGCDEGLLARRLGEEAYRPFDLTRGVLRVRLYAGDGAHALLFVIHHLVADFWSLAVLSRELGALYREEAGGPAAALPSLAAEPANLAHWQAERLAGAEGERLWAWWRERLAGPPPVLDLPADHPRPALQTHRGGTAALAIPRDLAERVGALAQAHGATPFVALLAAWAVQLGRYADQEDFAIGSPTAGRGSADLSGVVGYFVNPVALRADLSGDPSFAEVLERMRRTTVEALEHAGFPFPLLAERLQPERDPALPPIFQVMFAFQAGRPGDDPALPAFSLGEPGARIDLGGLALEALRLPERRAQVDLALEVAPLGNGRGWGAVLEHNADLFEGATAARMLGHFRTLLEAAAARPQEPAWCLPLLSAEERTQLLGEWNPAADWGANLDVGAGLDPARVGGGRRHGSPDSEFPPSWEGTSPSPHSEPASAITDEILLHRAFAAQARRTPDREALAAGGTRLTYAELDARSDRLARRLRRLGAGPEAVVAVCLERSVENVVALLAVLKAGGAFLPLDPAHPASRRDLMLRDSGARLLLTRRGLVDEVPSSVSVLDVDEEEREAVSGESAPFESGALPSSLAYVMYTSGSTGTPKGAGVSHGAAARHFAVARRAYGFGPGDRVLQFAAASFDPFLEQIFCPLLSGAAVVLRDEAMREPSELKRGLARHGITFADLPTGYLQEWVRSHASPLDGSPLRAVLTGGEALTPEAARRWLASGNDKVRLINGYGPTEAVVTATLHEVTADPGSVGAGAAVPIGRPLAPHTAYVLGRHGEPAPAGIPGELHLGGPCLARGYLGRPDLTAERFVADPFKEWFGERGGRLYRTGDRARWRPDGVLEFLGRLDHQVKIRGFRVEPGEIEAVLAGHPAVREVAVVARHGEAGLGLAAYVVPLVEMGDEALLPILRTWLADRLPDFMVPAAWAALPALPRTPGGKLDRGALPEPSAPAARAVGGAPRTPVEDLVAGIFAEVLGLDRDASGRSAVGRGDDFFELGGHSLLAGRVAARISRAFGIELPFVVLFQTPTVAGLAAWISAACAAGPSGRAPDQTPPVRPVLRPHEGRQDLPLSFAQRRLWLLDRLQPGSAAYNVPAALLLEGALRVEALTAAFAEVVRRHEVLRTRFAVCGGEPVQIVDPPGAGPMRLPLVDLSGLPPEVREETALRLAREEAARPLDLGGLQGTPLLRAALLRLGPQRHIELVSLHHIAADGWSLRVLTGELTALYEAFSAGRAATLPELPVQYADFAVWQRERLAGSAAAPLLDWWRERLAGAPTVLDLPGDRPRPAVRTERGEKVETLLSGGLAAGVRSLARQQGATPFMVLLAAFEALLLRYTGREDLLVGSVTAGRSRPEVEDLIGFFANTLVLRARLAGDPTFAKAVERAREASLGAWAHQDLPLERLIEELEPEREPGRTPLFQVVLALQDEPPVPELAGLAVRRLPLHNGTAKFDLTLELTERTDGLATTWELSRDLFDAATVRRMAGHFEILLAGAVDDPGRTLWELPLLGDDERRQVLAEWSARPTAAPLGLPVHRLFEDQARRTPERPALLLEDEEVTYAALNARANRLARHLVACGLAPEDPVGVALERSAETIEAFLAVLKAGGAYVPLDPSYPEERLAEMIEEVRVPLVVTRGWEASGPRIVDLDRDREAIAARSADDLPGPDVGRLAYLMFTSGSTGRPKAVAVEHRGIVRLVHGTDYARFGPEQVFLQLAPVSFDASTLEIWGALLNGGRLALFPSAVASLAELGEALARHRVTALWLTAGLFHQVVESRIEALRGLEQLLAGGDVLAPEAVARVLAELPGCRMVNGYGPTENTTFTCCFEAREPVPAGAPVPVGRPIPGTRVYVLDRQLRPVPAGVPGELLAGGHGLARGYLHRPDLTAERFVPSPFAGEADEPGARLYRTGDRARWRPDGEIELLGRLDRQVKIRGFRVEPAEIEAVLARHPAVAQAAVAVREEVPGDRRLAAFVVLRPDAREGLEELRSELRRKLPGPMIPAGLTALEALPLTPNGKVDREALARRTPERGLERPGPAEVVAPRTPTEQALAEIWSEVLGVERVGIGESFFALGGHSLSALRMVTRVQERFGVDLPLSEVFQEPTLEEVAQRVEDALLAQASDARLDELLALLEAGEESWQEEEETVR